MLTALFSDIHGNRQALEACLDHARHRKADRYAFLGDYVGYGADPEWVVATVREYVENGAIAVAGNHDRAVSDLSIAMNHNAELAIEWTRLQLSNEAVAFLDRLPLMIEETGRLYVHGDASMPAKFIYVTDPDNARRSMQATRAQVTFCGHVHVPAVYSLSTTDKLTYFQPIPSVGVPLLRQRQWLAVLGAVGQPRDGHSAACYGMFDDRNSELTYYRVPYDVETAAMRIRLAGLPHNLADRLSRGR